jgi:hypothetical protein
LYIIYILLTILQLFGCLQWMKLKTMIRITLCENGFVCVAMPMSTRTFVFVYLVIFTMDEVEDDDTHHIVRKRVRLHDDGHVNTDVCMWVSTQWMKSKTMIHITLCKTCCVCVSMSMSSRINVFGDLGKSPIIFVKQCSFIFSFFSRVHL